eukprot:1136685-Pelagomonas_calceolata.AAC.5
MAEGFLTQCCIGSSAALAVDDVVNEANQHAKTSWNGFRVHCGAIGEKKHPLPEVLLRHGACADWIPQPDVVSAPSLGTMCSWLRIKSRRMGAHRLVLMKLLHLFIKDAVVLRPNFNGQSAEDVNVLEQFVAKLVKLLLDKARIPSCWKHAKLSPLI